MRIDTARRSGPRKRHVRSSLALLTVAAMTALTGCSNGDAGESVSDPELHDEWTETYERAVEQYPASSVQAREIAAAAIEDGEMTFDQYRTAMLSALSCMEDAGLIFGGPDDSQVMSGMRVITWGVNVADDEAQEDANALIVEDCLAKEATLVENLYRSQPVAMRWYDDYIEGYREEMVECLESAGVSVDRNTPMRHIMAIDSEAWVQEGWANPCAMTTGLLSGLSQ